MGTVVKTWAFASDAEGLADQAVSGVVFAHDGAGAVKFTQGSKSQNVVERARRTSTGESWETWGVPAGSVVTDVQVTAWQERLVTNTKLTSHSIKARVVGSGGSTVHSAGELLDVALGTTTDASFQAGSAGTSRAVDSGSQASTTDVRLELEYAVVTSGGGGSANVDQRFDQLELTITYASAPVALAGAIAATSSLTGSLRVRRRLAGAIAGAGSTAGDVTARRRLAGSIAGQSTLAGDLAVAAGGGGVALAGVVAAASALSGALQVRRRLAGAAAGVAALSGALTLTRGLAGTIAAASSLSGSLRVRRRLSGTIAATAQLAGRLYDDSPEPDNVRVGVFPHHSGRPFR